MSRKFVVVLALLLISVHRLPAPIQEIPESPTPTPEKSAKPKEKPVRELGTLGKPNVASEKSSPLARSKSTPEADPFDGTWTGTYKTGWAGELQHTYVISGHGTLLRETIGPSEAHVWNTTCDGTTMRWSWTLNVSGASAFTPARNGRTAVFTVKATGIGGYETSTIFHRISP